MKMSRGNHKIGTDTLILNMCSATDCPSRKLGYCKLGKRCYALKAERLYPQCLPFRRMQEQQWDSLTVQFMADCISETVRRARGVPVTHLRFSEAGDFRTQEDVDRMSVLADLLDGTVVVYGYTARKDLDFSRIHSNMVVNGSSFMASNEFRAVPEYTGENIRCKMNCRICSLCTEGRGRVIEVKYH